MRRSENDRYGIQIAYRENRHSEVKYMWFATEEDMEEYVQENTIIILGISY